MQQVGKSAFLANAQAVDARSLPVPARRASQKALVGAEQIWVLHRAKVIQVFGAVMALIAIVVVFSIREPIAAGLGHVGTLLQGEFAEAGFAVGEIEISGQTLTEESQILAALGIEPSTSTISFDAALARDRIAELPAVESVTIRKRYPGDVIVSVTEKVPVARWRVDGVTFVVDASGEQIGEDRGSYGELPLVIGDGAADDALVMIRALDGFPQLSEDLIALSRIADRRWDMIFNTGLRVQLPEAGVAQALRRLVSYQDDFQLLDRDITIIDLRVPHLVAVRPTVREEEEAETE